MAAQLYLWFIVLTSPIVGALYLYDWYCARRRLAWRAITRLLVGIILCYFSALSLDALDLVDLGSFGSRFLPPVFLVLIVLLGALRAQEEQNIRIVYVQSEPEEESI